MIFLQPREPFSPCRGGGSDGFITKLNATGSALIYSSFFGGGSSDHCNGIAIDSDGNSYVTGSTGSTNFPISGNPFQSTHGGADSDAFVAKVNAAGSSLVYSTYLGGINRDDGRKIAVDTEGNAYVIGAVELQPPSSIDNFPTTPGALQTTYGGGGIDAIVAKLNPDPTVVPATNQLVYSTYLGGSDDDGGSSIAVDTFGNAYVTGATQSTDFPTANPLQTANGGIFDAFVSKLNANGSDLVYSTYLGGSNDDRGGGITIDVSGNVYVSGKTSSPNFPTTPGAFDTTFNGVQDAFVAKISDDDTPPTFGDCPVGGPFLLNSGLQSVGPIEAEDPESGIDTGASTLSESVNTSSVGTKTVTFIAVNNVGLQSTTDCNYDVQYSFSGFFQPIDNNMPNSAKAGQTIPIKWRLTDANGVLISDPNSFVSVSSTATPGSCGGSTDAIETYAGSSGLQYLGDGYWQFNWKTPKSYAGQCRTMSLNLNDGASGRTAAFIFK